MNTLKLPQTLFGQNLIRPWHDPVPKLLYKFFPPERIHVLRDCRVRFSQRAVFPDKNELQPEVAAFGTEEEIRLFIELEPERNLTPSLKKLIVKRILTLPGEHRRLIEITKAASKSPDQFGIFCLTEDPNEPKMWAEYANSGRGFVLAIDTTTAAFDCLKDPGKLGQVQYSDEPLGTLLGSYGVGTFFRKRAEYRHEREWRSVRGLQHLTCVPDSEPPLYLASLDPASVKHILIREECAVREEIVDLLKNNAKYNHVKVIPQHTTPLTSE
jgi:hypothetical protein